MRLKLIGVFLLVFLFLTHLPLFAASCSDSIVPSGVNPEDFWRQVRDDCQQKVIDSQNQQSTLNAALTVLNSKMRLTQAQIALTTTQIASLEQDISNLSEVVSGLDVSLTDLTKVYVARVQASYKRRELNPVSLFLSTDSFANFLTSVRYLNIVKAKDQLVLSEMQSAKNNYDTQKQLKIVRQKQVEALKATLVTQQTALKTQQTDKQRLLVLTQNDEKKYQALLQKANAEIEAIKAFTSGASPLSNQTHCDSWGCYYSQRDTQWFYNTIGGSSEILGRVGCLITSVAMVASHYGKSLKPSDIAGSSEPFFANTAYMVKDSWTVNGVTVDRTGDTISTGRIDDELAAGRPVIVGLYNGPAHFIVIKGKNDQGYIMDDPYLENGYDRPLSDLYKFSDITQLDIVRVH